MNLFNIASLIVNLIIFFLTIVGNSLVIVSIIKFDYLKSNANYLVGYLAFSDLLVGCTIPFMLGTSIILK